MKKLILTVLAALLALPAAASATGGSIEANGILCGDPRVVLDTFSTYQRDKTIRIRFVAAKTDAVKKVERTATPGWKRYWKFWVVPRTMFKVWDHQGNLIFKLWTGPKNHIGQRCLRVFELPVRDR